MHWVGMGWVGLRWVVFGWVGSRWVGLRCIALGHVGLGWVGFGCVGLRWVALGWVRWGWVALGCIGLRWLSWVALGCVGLHWVVLATIPLTSSSVAWRDSSQNTPEHWSYSIVTFALRVSEHFSNAAVPKLKRFPKLKQLKRFFAWKWFRGSFSSCKPLQNENFSSWVIPVSQSSFSCTCRTHHLLGFSWCSERLLERTARPGHHFGEGSWEAGFPGTGHFLIKSTEI